MATSTSARPGWAILAVGAAFLLSGTAALVHQVVWQRILLFHTGVGVTSVALIVAAFLGGLGLGSHLGGVLSARATPRGALFVFGLLELTVAAYAAASPWLFYDLLYRKGAWLYASLTLGGLLHLGALLLPTTCMGMSLPFLVRALVASTGAPARTIGVLYGVNVLGAALGALLTPWLLVPWAGLRGALLAGAGLNLLAGGGALAVGATRSSGPRAAEAGEAAPSPSLEPSLSFARWTALYALTGFCAIALEIVWFRVVELAAKSTAFAFGTVLFVYLAGLGLGSLVGGALATRIERPLRAFLACQTALLAYAGLALSLLVRIPPDFPLYAWFFAYWSEPLGLGPASGIGAAALARLYLLLPAALFGLPTLLMGVSFAVLQRAVQDDASETARRVGLLQAANIGGCVLGSLVVGLASLELIGTTGTMRALLGIGVGLALLGLRVARGFALVALGLALLAFLIPGQERFWSRLHGLAAPAGYVSEDATGVVALTSTGDGAFRLYNNGWSHSSLPFGAHSIFGLVPAVVHAEPRQVAIIGLGSGDTAWAAGCRAETERVTVFEIRAAQEGLLRRVAAEWDLPQLRRFLADPRVRIRVEDGRRALEHEEAFYDVIETDPQHPAAAGAGLLYSLEFYELAARRLKPGGVMCAWAPTGRVTDTFRRVFRHTLVLPESAILIGSDAPLAPDARDWRRRLRSPEVRAYLDPFPVDRVAEQLEGAVRLGRGLRHGGLREPNLDLFPRDEFALPWLAR